MNQKDQSPITFLANSSSNCFFSDWEAGLQPWKSLKWPGRDRRTPMSSDVVVGGGGGGGVPALVSK